MARELCIIHANCQGDALHALLAATPDFIQRYEIKKFTNYQHEHIPAKDFARCDLLLYQELGAAWGENAAANLLDRLSVGSRALKIPNMFFNGYWPLWTNSTTMAYGDMLLEHLAARGYTREEMLHICQRGKLSAMYDLNALFTASQEREAAKEQGAVVETLPLIRALWREEQLFHTVNHPGPRLIRYVADGVLAALGFAPVPELIWRVFAAQREEFVQPIHPQVGQYFGLPFATAARRYPVYGQEMTYAQYAAAYTECLAQGTEGIRDFVVYLHLLAQRASACAA